MEYPIEEIRAFAREHYKGKDIMHDFTHIERIKFVLDNLAKTTELAFNEGLTEIALYFHGIIYSHEPTIRKFLEEVGLPEVDIETVTKIAWESQKESKPTTPEGLLLHDAHMLEGGRNFEIIKSLITGSVRGQTLEETMVYIENNLIHKGHCYTEEGIVLYADMKKRTIELLDELNQGLGRNIA